MLGCTSIVEGLLVVIVIEVEVAVSPALMTALVVEPQEQRAIIKQRRNTTTAVRERIVQRSLVADRGVTKGLGKEDIMLSFTRIAGSNHKV